MDKILNKSHIRIEEKAADWEEAIRKAGAVLVEAGKYPARVCGKDDSVCQGAGSLYRNNARVRAGSRGPL